MPNVPAGWGPKLTSKDYEMFLGGATVIDPLISLVGHAMTGLEDELTDPVTQNYVVKERGKIVDRVRTLRPAQKVASTGTVLAGDAIWSPALDRARRAGASCRSKIYGLALCLDNPEFEHAYVWPEALFNPPTRVNDFITIEDTVPAVWQFEFRAENDFLVWTLGGFLQSNQTPPLYAVAFQTEDCASCNFADLVNSDIVAVGGIGGEEDPLIIYQSTSRGGNVSALTNPAPDGSIGTSVWSEGDFILVGFADAVDAAGTIGGTVFSSDNGVSFDLDAGISEPIYGVSKFNGQYIAVGGTATGLGVIYVSDDGVNWDAVVSSVLTGGGNHALTFITVDNDDNSFYTGGQNGVCYKGTVSGSSIVISAVALPGVGTTLLTSGNVFGEGHVAIGGATGYYAETLDNGGEWKTPAVPGTSTIHAIAGDEERSMIGAGTAYVERWAKTQMAYKNRTLSHGAATTGDVRGIARAPESDGFNYFVAVTDDGEIVFFRPFHPNA